MLLYIMRHAAAVPVGEAVQDDVQRPLSGAGRVQAHAVAEGLLRQDVALGTVLCSPLLRAQQTGLAVASVFGFKTVETAKALGPNGSPAGLRPLLDTCPQESGVLLVGHHPDVSLWIAFLANIDYAACPVFGPASVAALLLSKKNPKAEFLWFQTSDQLAQL